MMVEMARATASTSRCSIPGNPVKLVPVAEGPETRVPWVGEHTDEVLRAELGLDDAELDSFAPRVSSPDRTPAFCAAGATLTGRCCGTERGQAAPSSTAAAISSSQRRVSFQDSWSCLARRK